jgi:DNA invertase Pin-like site-specific DNA recombinase
MAQYGYTRVSSTEQDTTIQVKALERAGVPVGNIVEEKRSGVAKDRPVRAALLAKLVRDDVLWCWKLDRLGRSTQDVLAVVKDLDQRGIRFRCVTQDIDTGTASGRFMITLLAAVAELEREMIRERTMAGRMRRAEEGLHPGGVPLYGFAADHVTIVDEEAELLRDAARQILHGVPMNQVVDSWNTAGYRTRAGKLWTVKTLRRVLSNPYVVPILEQDTYDRLARLFGQPDRQRLGRPAEHLLSGVLVCHRCGQAMYLVRTRQRDGSMRRVYACRKGMGGRFTGCGSTRLAADRADEWAAELFIEAVRSDAFAEAMAQRQAELLADDGTTAEELDAWREEIGELEQVMPTRFAPPNARERHAELRRMVEQATARLMAQPNLQALIDLPRSEDRLRERWEGWSVAERRAWLRRLVERIDVHPATARGRASVPAERLEPVWKL